MKKLIIIDSNALIHRAFHALPPLTNKKGELINAVYGYTSVLIKVLREQKPDYIAATFDLAGPTFRNKEYKEYKAKRVKAPQQLYDQIKRVKQVVRAFNIPIYEKEGFEADDLIGTIAKKVEKEKNIESLIVTGDLDVLQLISTKTKAYLLKRGIKDTVIYDKKAVKDRYGLSPNQIADLKGLKGDTSDNIIGVPGVGEKTAVNLLREFGSLKKIYEQIETAELNPKLKARLLEYKDQALFSMYLGTIKKDVPIDFKISDCHWKDFDKQKVTCLFNELSFKTMLSRLEKDNMI